MTNSEIMGKAGLQNLTLTQEKIFRLLSDGDRHSREEIFQKCINDELAQLRVIKNHISFLRKRIGPVGLLIVCEVGNGKLYYRMSRHIGSLD